MVSKEYAVKKETASLTCALTLLRDCVSCIVLRPGVRHTISCGMNAQPRRYVGAEPPFHSCTAKANLLHGHHQLITKSASLNNIPSSMSVSVPIEFISRSWSIRPGSQVGTGRPTIDGRQCELRVAMEFESINNGVYTYRPNAKFEVCIVRGRGLRGRHISYSYIERVSTRDTIKRWIDEGYTLRGYITSYMDESNESEIKGSGTFTITFMSKSG